MTMMATERATQAEKAEAWDRLMRFQGSDSDAITEAWRWLNDTVETRERADRIAAAAMRALSD